MNRSLTRIVALLLVHCVLSDSAFASMTSLSPRGWERVGVRGDNFLEQALALGAAGQTRPLPGPEAESVMVHVIESAPADPAGPGLVYKLKVLGPQIEQSRMALYSLLRTFVAFPDAIPQPGYSPADFGLTQANIPDTKPVTQVYKSLSKRWARRRLDRIHGSIDFHTAVMTLLSNDHDELRLLTDWATTAGTLPLEMYRAMFLIALLRDQQPHGPIDNELLSRVINRFVHLAAIHQTMPFDEMSKRAVERHPNEAFAPLNFGQLLFWTALSGIDPELWTTRDNYREPILGLFPWERNLSGFGNRVAYAERHEWIAFLREAEMYQPASWGLVHPWTWTLNQYDYYVVLLALPNMPLNTLDEVVPVPHRKNQADFRGRFMEPLLRTIEVLAGRQPPAVDPSLFSDHIRGLMARAA
jgi:hypothetical protein